VLFVRHSTPFVIGTNTSNNTENCLPKQLDEIDIVDLTKEINAGVFMPNGNPSKSVF
jgi:hypothetical protein